jgi:hypothetical protein
LSISEKAGLVSGDFDQELLDFRRSFHAASEQLVVIRIILQAADFHAPCQTALQKVFPAGVKVDAAEVVYEIPQDFEITVSEFHVCSLSPVILEA